RFPDAAGWRSPSPDPGPGYTPDARFAARLQPRTSIWRGGLCSRLPRYFPAPTATPRLPRIFRSRPPPHKARDRRKTRSLPAPTRTYRHPVASESPAGRIHLRSFARPPCTPRLPRAHRTIRLYRTPETEGSLPVRSSAPIRTCLAPDGDEPPRQEWRLS